MSELQYALYPARAGIAALYERLQGGASEAVLRMLYEISTVNRIPDFIKQVKLASGG